MSKLQSDITNYLAFMSNKGLFSAVSMNLLVLVNSASYSGRSNRLYKIALDQVQCHDNTDVNEC